jgi:hypothetical protein
MFQPDARQAAMLVLHLLHPDRTGRVTRARLTELTIRHLWNRTRVQEGFLLDVQEILLKAGWAFFWAGSTSYGIIRQSAVEGWPRISSKRIREDLDRLAEDRDYPERFFERAERLLFNDDRRGNEEDDAGE